MENKKGTIQILNSRKEIILLNKEEKVIVISEEFGFSIGVEKFTQILREWLSTQSLNATVTSDCTIVGKPSNGLSGSGINPQ
ncbi:hypothetical protein SAMN05421679_101519 [Epilithonimonas pallida]|uniref:Uncharacterized protein n=1 Tax=Epilithonimonas pallida TaxID=373671 RepID=A0ABY1R0P6_9FLAO|nr:hypothetical protein SAMN05421679_101519 [Epilithonimonas pallida]